MERNRGGRPRHPDVLTPAEWRVLEALREGGTNAEIGARLGISADAVKYHVSNMLGKLELRDRRALAAWRPEERRGRLPAWFAVPAALAYVGRPLVWVGLGTAAAVGVTVTVVAAVVAVAVLLVVVGGDGDPPAVALPPVATPDATSTPAAVATVEPAATTPTVAPAPSPAASPAPTPTVTPSPSPTPVPTSPPGPSPTPTATLEPTGPVMRYDRFDPAGEASTPGSYAFLMPDGEAKRVVETYEELRTASAVLLINVIDGDGNTQGDLYEAVEADDTVEWRSADDCWMRMQVTEELTGTATTMQYAVKPYSYPYGGCDGAVPASLDTEFRWEPPNLGSAIVRGAIMHGPIFARQRSWNGTDPPLPTEIKTDVAAITWPPSPLPNPDFGTSWVGSVGEAYGGILASYAKADWTASFGIAIGRLWTDITHHHRYLDPDARAFVAEFVLIDGHPGVLTYDLDVDALSHISLNVYDLEHDVRYSAVGDGALASDREAFIQMVRKFMVIR